MYCFIKYTHIPSVIDEKNDSSDNFSTITSLNSLNSNMVYDNKELIVNTNCPIQILLDYICAEVGFDKNSDFDLCDDTGSLASVKMLKPWIYATEVLQPKLTYYIVMCERGPNGQLETVKPLVNKSSKIYYELMSKLRKHISPLKRIPFDKPTKSSKTYQRTPATSSANLNATKHSKKWSSTKSARSRKSNLS